MARPDKFGVWQQHQLRKAAGRHVTAAEPSVLRGLQERLDRLLADVDRPVRILDAGCGKQLQIPIADERFVVGMDIRSDQVENNAHVDEGIVGDVQTYPFQSESFDVVVCWNVLEHLPDPPAALANFENALKPDGLLVLAGPHPRSFKGTVTDLTPFWVHKLVWKRYLSSGRSEKFPTYMSDFAQPEHLTEFAAGAGMTVEFLRIYEGWDQKSFRYRSGAVGRLFKIARRCMEVLTLGTIRSDVTDFVMVCVKRRGEPSRLSPGTG